MAKHDLVFWSNRSTPSVVTKGASPKKKPGYGKQTRRRAATAAEEKTIARGGWVRVNQNGKKPSDKGYQRGSKYRPQLRKKGK